MEGVRIDAHVSGLPASRTGFYGFHIHTGTRCSGRDFTEALGHYNPENTEHPLHTGDLVPLLATKTSEAWLSFISSRFTVKDITGRTVIIHAERDDFTTQPAGDAGERIGCGVIRIL